MGKPRFDAISAHFWELPHQDSDPRPNNCPAQARAVARFAGVALIFGAAAFGGT